MNLFKFLLKFVSAFAFGFTIFYFAVKRLTGSTSAPWALITLMIFPFSYCAAVLFKVSEADENTSLSESEIRRLRPLIDYKKQLSFLIIFYLLAAFLGAMGMLIIAKEQALIFILYHLAEE